MTNISGILIEWYNTKKRSLPWRDSKNAYYIWLSEIILQQTRIEQGLSYYEKFVDRFPRIEDLANAEEDEVLRLWQGLGYYSRARNLHHTAKTIVNEYKGVFPNTYDEIVKLKGVGDYTASAISSFAFKEVQPVLDGNVFRFISRMFGLYDDIAQAKSRKVFKKVLFEVIDQKNPDTFNQAIMDFGSIHCSPKSPKCVSCPFQLECYAFTNKAQEELPVKVKKIKRRSRYFSYYVITDGEFYYLKKRPETDIWAGLYEFTMKESSDSFIEPNKEDLFSLEIESIEAFEPNKKHVLSHQDIYSQFFLVKVKELNQENNKYSLDEVDGLPKPILIENFLREKVYNSMVS